MKANILKTKTAHCKAECPILSAPSDIPDAKFRGGFPRVERSGKHLDCTGTFKFSWFTFLETLKLFCWIWISFEIVLCSIQGLPRIPRVHQSSSALCQPLSNCSCQSRRKTPKQSSACNIHRNLMESTATQTLHDPTACIQSKSLGITRSTSVPGWIDRAVATPLNATATRRRGRRGEGRLGDGRYRGARAGTGHCTQNHSEPQSCNMCVNRSPQKVGKDVMKIAYVLDTCRYIPNGHLNL